KAAVLEELAFQRDEAGFTEWDEAGLCEASGFVFYNTSPWTLQRKELLKGKLLCQDARNRQEEKNGNNRSSTESLYRATEAGILHHVSPKVIMHKGENS
ncbi:MAG: SAM-dependent DNA methyltransferase, partial [Candidatus Electrothrix sp. AX5]|nr:SAM-dependent DNA methyltransferase [Candidatus Electrothrix sp. AX5]